MAGAALMLPAVLDDAQALVLASSGARRQRALRAQAGAYVAASKLASKAGDGQLAWLAADRAATAAGLADATALSAVAAYQAACALLRLPGRLSDAETIAVAAAADIGPTATGDDADLLSARGSLLLLAALVAARRNDAQAARRYLTEAASAAEQLGRDDNRLWTAFGPTNVVIHEISVAVTLGQPDEAAKTRRSSRLTMDAYSRTTGQVLYLVVCAAPPARRIGELVELTQRLGWTVCIIATPQAAEWVDVDGLAHQTGYPVRSTYKHPDDPDVLPPADAIAVAPATFNTINKWAAGISDTFALGILNEALGLGLPIVVSPYAKPPLAAHAAFARSLQFLRDSGVTLTATEAIRPDRPDEPFRWSAVTHALPG